MRHAPLLALVAVAACTNNPWPDVEDFSQFDDPASLGAQVLEGSVFQPTFIGGTFVDGSLYVAVHQGPGYDLDGAATLDTQRVFHVTGTDVDELPEPPVAMDAVFGAVGFDGLVGFAADGVAVLADSTWTKLDPPALAEGTFGQIAAQTPEHIAIVDDQHVYLRVGSSWAMPPLPTTTSDQSIRILAIDDTGVRVAYDDAAGGVTTTAYDWSAQPLGTPVTDATLQPLLSGRANGTLADCQFAVQDRYVHFHANTLEPGGPADATISMQEAPSSSKVIAFATRPDGTSLPSAVIVEGGQAGAPVITGVVPEHVAVVLPLVDQHTAGAVALLSISDFTGRRGVYAAQFPLPFTTAWP